MINRLIGLITEILRSEPDPGRSLLFRTQNFFHIPGLNSSPGGFMLLLVFFCDAPGASATIHNGVVIRTQDELLWRK
jgi:hypothetical protein